MRCTASAYLTALLVAVADGFTFRSSFAVALINTSPEEQVIDVSFGDIFGDQVWVNVILNSLGFVLIRSFKSKESGDATYTIYDLWKKDEKGEWGLSLGSMSGAIPGVAVAGHQTKVWKLVPSSKRQKRGMHAHPHLS